MSTLVSSLKASSQRSDNLANGVTYLKEVLERKGGGERTSDYFHGVFALGDYSSSFFADFCCPPGMAKEFAQRCLDNLKKAMADEDAQIVKVAEQLLALKKKDQ
jgi:hypothetical protein